MLLQGKLCRLHRLLTGVVPKIQILLVVGTIASDLLVQFTAFDGACCTAVPCWHISTAGITIIPIIEMLHGIRRVGAVSYKQLTLPTNREVEKWGAGRSCSRQ